MSVPAGPRAPDAVLAVTIDLPDDPSAPGRARALVRETLAAWDLTRLVDDATVVVSELATNALSHGLPPVVLTLRRLPRLLRMDVSDARRSVSFLDELSEARPRHESGRGCGIVETLADHWGFEQTQDAKSAFASWDLIPLQPHPGGASAG